MLPHYDPAKELLLACDASPYGVGTVLSQVLDDGSDKPVAFTSRSLTPAEKRYSQLDREGLAIIFGVKRFKQYLLGRYFTIVSDQKLLQLLFDDSCVVPQIASVRLQHWALVLGAYDYTILYKPGSEMESKVRGCTACQKHQKMPLSSPLHPCGRTTHDQEFVPADRRCPLQVGGCTHCQHSVDTDNDRKTPIHFRHPWYS